MGSAATPRPSDLQPTLYATNGVGAPVPVTNTLRIIPVVLPFWLLGAHFLRTGRLGAMTAAALAPLILLIRRRWALRVAQSLLLLGASYWLVQLALMAGLRQRMGLPWARLAAILVLVSAATAWAALLLEGKGMLARYPRAMGSAGEGIPAGVGVAAFWLTALGLGFVQVKVTPPMLLPERLWPGGGWPLVLALSTYAGWLASRLMDPSLQATTRSRLWLAFSALFFVQLLLGMAGLEWMLMSGRLHLPVPAVIVGGPLYRGAGLFMPVLFGVAVLLVGPAWCSYFCYFGAWDNTVAAGRRPRDAPGGWRRWLRWVTLVGVAAVALALRAAGAPGWLAAAMGLGFGLVGIGIMLLWSRRVGTMAHCTWYCPMGLLAVGLGRLSPHRVRLSDACTGCGRCSAVCRYDALLAEDIRRRRPGPSCTLCGDCIGQCRHDAIGYRFPGLSALSSRAVFLALVASFHAICLGVARI